MSEDRKINRDRELFEVLKVKILYERMIREKIGSKRTFAISRGGKVGAVQFKQFLKIADGCKELGVRPEDYLAVMFSLPPPMAQKWGYPYLGYVASDKAFEIYRDRTRFLGRVFPSVGDAVSAISPLNYEERFTNCFYNGFMVARSAVEREGVEETRKMLFLIPLFYAFSETFTPEFISLHSRFSDYTNASLDGEDAEMRVLIGEYVKEIVPRLGRDSLYARQLKKARKSVIEREKETVRRIHSHLTGWEEVFCLLI